MHRLCLFNSADLNFLKQPRSDSGKTLFTIDNPKLFLHKSLINKDITVFKNWRSVELYTSMSVTFTSHARLEYDESKSATNSKAPALTTHLITTDNCIADL